jgi:hypothetical protein
MTSQFTSIMTGGSCHVGKSPQSAESPGAERMMTVHLVEHPIDEILKLCEDERLCDSTRIDNTVRPFRVISQCFKPAEWIYVMKCCGSQALACDPCHEQHLQPPLYPRYCAHCSHSFSTLADGARAVYRV